MPRRKSCRQRWLVYLHLLSTEGAVSLEAHLARLRLGHIHLPLVSMEARNKGSRTASKVVGLGVLEPHRQ